jgi:DNA polymerase-1
MQQELRVLGHFGDGVLMEKFGLDPTLDVHDLAAKLIDDNFGIPVTRDDTKTLGFGLLYGMGLGALAERLNVDVNTAKKIKGAYLGIFPELKELQDGLKQYAAENRPLTTWGGRQYYCEEAKWSDKYNRMQTYEYKLLNYLIQGSSADCTKEAIIRYDTARNKGRVLLSVHDEINLSVPKKYVKSEMQLLREVMASVEFDVPMLSDGATGLNWGSLTKFEEKAL